MSKTEKLLIQFRDGFARLAKIDIRPTDDSYLFFDSLNQWSFHASGEVHLKKLNKANWIEPSEEREKKYLHTNKFTKLKGFAILVAPLMLSGLRKIEKKEKDKIVLKTKKLLKTPTWVILSIWDGKADIKAFAKRNSFDEIVVYEKTTPKIVFGIKFGPFENYDLKS
ncbi:MAG: hypothetical protein WC408_05345 [Candidatus Micrarchaeia archaeon]|jgi:hypothetical protein